MSRSRNLTTPFVLLGCVAVAVGIAVFSVMSIAGGGLNLNIAISTPADERREAEFAEAWKAPPPGADAERLLPQRVHDWERVSQSDTAKIDELAIDRAGFHAHYRGADKSIDVFVFEVADDARSGILQSAENALYGPQYRNSASHRGSDRVSERLDFSVSPPVMQGRAWAGRGWMFVFITHDSAVDLDAFKHDYLSAIAEAE